MRERQIEKYLCEHVRKAGGLCWKFVSPGSAGVPDRIVVLPEGRVYFAELKTDTGRLSDIQKWRQQELARCGAEVRTLYGMEGVRAFLSEIIPIRTETGAGGTRSVSE